MKRSGLAENINGIVSGGRQRLAFTGLKESVAVNRLPKREHLCYTLLVLMTPLKNPAAPSPLDAPGFRDVAHSRAVS